MSVGQGSDHTEIKRRIHDCRGRLRRQRASQKSAAHDDNASLSAEPEIAEGGEGKDNDWGEELMLEEEAKV